MKPSPNSEFLMRKLRSHVCEQENKSNFWLVLKDFAVFLVFTVFFKVSPVSLPVPFSRLKCRRSFLSSKKLRLAYFRILWNVSLPAIKKSTYLL